MDRSNSTGTELIIICLGTEIRCGLSNSTKFKLSGKFKNQTIGKTPCALQGALPSALFSYTEPVIEIGEAYELGCIRRDIGVNGCITFLVSFLFVGHQLRQNREMERASNQREILNQARSFFSLTRSDLRILVAVSECMRDYATANQEKKHIFNMWVVDYMLLVEQAWYMRRDGYINTASYDGFKIYA